MKRIVVLLLLSFTLLSSTFTSTAQVFTRNPFQFSYFQPHFGINAESYFHGNDLLFSFGLGLEETGYDFGASFNVGFRPYLKKVLIQDENDDNTYYQYRERIMLFSIDLEKRFFFLEYAKGENLNRIGIYTKAKFGYLHANYRGLSESLNQRFLIAPGAGASWEFKNARISLGYLRLDQGNEMSANMIDFTLNLFFNKNTD
jgi:hypothetical protein